MRTAPGRCPRCGTEVGSEDRYCRRCGFGPLAAALPGWYPDPLGEGALRYWDGRAWTPHVANPQPTVPGPGPTGPPATVELPPGAGIGAAVVGFVCGVALASLVDLVLAAAGNPGGTAVELGLSELGLWAGMLGAVLYVSRRRGVGRLSVDFGLAMRPVDLGVGALGAVAAEAASVLVALPIYTAFHNLVRQPQVGLPTSEVHGAVWVVYGLVVILGAPPVEELFFRGLVQGQLVGRWGPARGIAATSVIFGAAHLIGWQGLGSLLAVTSIAVAGSVLGFLRYRTGRLGTSMVAHSLFNTVAFGILASGAAVR